MRYESPTSGELHFKDTAEAKENRYEPGSSNIEGVRFSNSGPWKRIFDAAIEKIAQTNAKETDHSSKEQALREETLEMVRNNPQYQKILQVLTISWDNKLSEAHYTDLKEVEGKMAKVLSEILIDIQNIDKGPK